MKEPLKVIACATKRKSGYIFTGAYHGECDHAELDFDRSSEYYPPGNYPGCDPLDRMVKYMLSNGEVTHRHEAFEVADRAGQLDSALTSQVTSLNFCYYCQDSFDLLQAKAYERDNNRKVAERLKAEDRRRTAYKADKKRRTQLALERAPRSLKSGTYKISGSLDLRDYGVRR